MRGKWLMNMEDKLKLAIDMCEDKGHNYNKYNYIYPFATENIKGYMNCFDLNGKSLLTVGSSGDQVFNAINMGCSDITVLDICPFTRENTYLKAAAMEFMSAKKFFDFFSYRNYRLGMFKNNIAFADTTFIRILSNLRSMDNDVYFFWNQLFKRYRGIVLRRMLFAKNEFNYKILMKVNNYLDSNSDYIKLRNRLDLVKDIKFIQGDIFNVIIDGTYDNINLSNLATCYSLDDLMSLFKKMEAILNPDGNMLVGYLYDTEDNYYTKEDDIYNIDKSLKMFPEGTTIRSINGINGYVVNSSRVKDSIITYKKVKKISKFC